MACQLVKVYFMPNTKSCSLHVHFYIFILLLLKSFCFICHIKYKEVKMCVEHSPQRCKDRQKFMGPIWRGVLRKKGLTPDKNRWRRNQWTNTLKLLQENTERKFKICFCSLFLLMTCGQLSFHTLFLSPGDYLKSIGRIKLILSKLRQHFVCLSTVPMVGLQQCLTTT